MSEEEEVYSDEEEEVEADEAEEAAEAPAEAPAEAAATDDAPAEQEEQEAAEKPRQRAPAQVEEVNPESLTEAEQAMLAQKRRAEEEAALKMQDYEQRRQQELQQVDQELRELKEKQIERKRQREVEEAEFAERRRQDDLRRRQEEEERKAKIDAERQRRQEDKNRRQNLMAGAFAGFRGEASDGKNFVLPEKGEKGEKPGHLTQSSGGGRKGLSKEQKEEAKRNYMSIVNRPVDVSSLLPNDIKAQIKKLHSKILKLEGDKYDLEARHERLDYDLKELTARQQQAARQKAIASGQEPTDGESNMPPKVNVSSKFDRAVDRRTYGDKRTIFESPYDKPPPSIAHGSGRPPAEWGIKSTPELDQIRQKAEPRKYVEHEPVEGARPPVEVIPMQVPAEDATEEPPSNSKSRRGRGAAAEGEEVAA